MADSTDKDLQELRTEIEALKKELSNIGDSVSNIAQAAAQEGSERIRAVADHTRSQARETLGAFEKEVQERPLTSIAAALGIGFVLGKLLDR